MNVLHEVTTEYYTRHEHLLVLHTSCRGCGLPYVVTGRTVREAQRRVLRRSREHRGFAYAAGRAEAAA